MRVPSNKTSVTLTPARTSLVEVQVAAERFTAQAVLATGSEHARLWRLMTMVYPPYMAYQAKTARVIPLFRLVRNAP